MRRNGRWRDPRGRPRLGGMVARGLAGGLILTLLVATFLALPGQMARGQASLVITMGDIFFEPGSFSVNPGENVTLRLTNDGALQHTFTLFEVVDAQVPVDNNAALQDFHARSTPLVDVFLEGGQGATVNLTVPAAEGVYTFVCMVPGHAVGGMHGLMVVGMRTGGPDILGGIGIVQGLLIITLIGVVVFAVIYQVRSTRP